MDFAGRLGPDDGRYLVRSSSGDAEHVLVVGGVDGLAAGFRRGRRRRGRARPAGQEPERPPIPVTRLTVIRPGAFATEEDADAWLRDTATSETDRAELVDAALLIVNRALHAHGVAAQDPHGAGVSATAAIEIRIGYGSGDELADGRWAEAVGVELGAGRRHRTEALRPQERLAAVLGGREPTDACETLLLRARGDLDEGRSREAALQLRVGLEALLAEIRPGGVEAPGAAEQTADLAALEGRRSITGTAANEALAGELSGTRADELAETLRLCERVLRRRRILAQ